VAAEPDDEHRWVERARENDPEAIGWLYERYVDRIYRYVYLQVGDPSEAEDITEHVFLKMIESFRDFEWRRAPFSSWLFRIARNRVVDAFRRDARRPRAPVETLRNVVAPDREDPQRHAERAEFREHLRDAMGHLTDLQAQVILLKYGLELTNAEVGELLSRTPNAVNALQYDALRNLRKLLTLKGYTPRE
jgi:RNA polymerase sigma-70 factor (ECF subfamily)